MIRFRSVLLALAMAAAIPSGSLAQASHETATVKKDLPHLQVKGDVASDWVLAEGWAPIPVTRDGDGKITEAPFHCSVCAAEDAYAPGAKLPEKADKLCNRPAREILIYLENDHKLKPVVISMANTVLVADLPPIPAKTLQSQLRDWMKDHFPKAPANLDRHARAHLYALRYLHVEAQFLDLLCLLPNSPDFRGPAPGKFLGSASRGEIYLFPSKDPYQEFGRHFFRGFGPLTSWWWFADSEVSVSALFAGDTSDPVLAARFDHQLGHHLLYQYKGFYYHFPVWITEGLGHFFERRHRQYVDTFCLLGFVKDFTWEEKNWWGAAKTTVGAGGDLKLQSLALVTKLEELLPKQHGQAWSMVSYMIGVGKPRFRRFVDTMKSKAPEEGLPEVQYRAVETAYECDLETFQNAWRTWVKATKPPAPRK